MFIFIFIGLVLNVALCEKSKSTNGEVVYPRVVPHTEINRRFKRSNSKYEESDAETFYIDVKNLTIKTKFNRDLVVDGDYVVQWASSKGKKRPKSDQSHSRLERCLPLHGEVQGVPNSSAAITICSNHFFGLLTLGNQSFFLQPTRVNGNHVLYETKEPSLKDMKDKYDRTAKNQFKKFYEDNKIFEQETPKCTAWEMNKHGSRFVELSSSSCPGNFFPLFQNHTRSTRSSDSRFSTTELPYRVVKGCGRRKKRAVTICDTGENYDMARDVASPDYFEILESQFRFGNIRGDTPMPRSESNSHPPRTWYDEDKARPFLKGRIMNRRGFNKANSVSKWINNANSVSKWIKIVIGVDYDVIKFHGELTQQYIYTIFNIVSSLFKKISIINLTKIVIKKLILYSSREDSAVRKGNMQYPLYNVNQWNRVVYDEAKEKHDMGLWYTHYPLRPDVASAPGPYMCNKMRSCILVQDVGWVSAIKIAHGIGHLVGLNHDGEIETNNYCASEALLHATVMSKMIPDVNPAPRWSTCSVQQYNELISEFNCLGRPPLTDDNIAYLPGVFSLDDQCRIEFGDGWVFCIRVTLKDPCAELWCNRASSRRRSCMTRMTQTLEGTPCGRGKRCINGTCADPRWDLDPQDYPEPEYSSTILPSTSSRPPQTSTPHGQYPPGHGSTSQPYPPGGHPTPSPYPPGGHPTPSPYPPGGHPTPSPYPPGGHPTPSPYPPGGHGTPSPYPPGGHGTPPYPPGSHGTPSPPYPPPGQGPSYGSTSPPYPPPSYGSTSPPYGPPSYGSTSPPYQPPSYGPSYGTTTPGYGSQPSYGSTTSGYGTSTNGYGSQSGYGQQSSSLYAPGSAPGFSSNPFSQESLLSIPSTVSRWDGVV